MNTLPRQIQRRNAEEEKDAFKALSTPIGFIQGYLGLELYPWQKQVVSWYGDMQGRVKGAVAAANGSGKSERIIGSLALWVLAIFRHGKVVITSKDSRQLDHQIWPSIVRHSHKFPSFSFTKRRVTNGMGGEIILFTTDEPGRAEGYHASLPEGPLLMIFDEAKSIEEKIFQAADRCTFNGYLLISSTGVCEGRFYEAFHAQRDQYLTRVVTVDECPHIPPEKIEALLGQYGEDHPLYRSIMYSEFMPEGEGLLYFFARPRLDAVLSSPPPFKEGNRIAFLDFAGGRDENVLALRTGNRIEIIKAWKETNEMAAIGQFVREFRRLGLSPDEIWGDAAGMGKPMCARLEETGWPINRWNASERANQEYEYHDQNVEVWDSGAKAINDGEVIIPDDETLLAQLCSRRRAKPDSRGRLTIEPKEEMIARGIKSPDRADAVIFCAARMRSNASPVFDIGPLQYLTEEELPDYMEGSYAGG